MVNVGIGQCGEHVNHVQPVGGPGVDVVGPILGVGARHLVMLKRPLVRIPFRTSEDLGLKVRVSFSQPIMFQSVHAHN